MRREAVLESARLLDEIVTAVKKRHGGLFGHDVLPRFIHVLLDRAEAALVEAASGLTMWADGSIDEDGARCDAIVMTDHANAKAEDSSN